MGLFFIRFSFNRFSLYSFDLEQLGQRKVLAVLFLHCKWHFFTDTTFIDIVRQCFY